MEEIKRYKTSDLVLKIDKNYDPTKLPLQDWDRYLDILVNGRQYQKEAIIDTIIFLASGLYKNTTDLVEKNWNDSSNVELKNRYSNLDEYLHHLQIPNKLSDTATVKLVFTKPDLTTYEHIIENVEPCTLNDFSVTFPYSEDLYGNWTAEAYNNDILIAPEVYIQILTEEEWERRKAYSDIKTILFILGAAALAYMLIGGGNNG